MTKRINVSINFETDVKTEDEEELKAYLRLFIKISLPEWFGYTSISNIEVK